MTLTIASMNIDRAGAAKFQNTLAFTQHFQADAYALQQLDINDLEMPRYVHSWRQAGAQLILSRPEFPNNCRRVGLATSLPVRPFPLRGSLAATRVAAGLVQVQSAGQVRPLVLAAMYGFPSDPSATDRVVQQFLDEVRPLKCMYVLFGDFNWQRGEGGLLDTLLSEGRLRCLDDDFHSLLPGTSPSRARRIDFAVGHPLIAATRIDHEDGPADHKAVKYDLDFELSLTGHCLPKRASLAQDRSAVDIEAGFQAAWTEQAFADCLQEGRLDDAWGLLSGAAEAALGAERGSANLRAFDPVLYELLVLRGAWRASDAWVVDSSSSSWNPTTFSSGDAFRPRSRDSVS